MCLEAFRVQNFKNVRDTASTTFIWPLGLRLASSGAPRSPHRGPVLAGEQNGTRRI
jgi:hypothetical protein